MRVSVALEDGYDVPDKLINHWNQLWGGRGGVEREESSGCEDLGGITDTEAGEHYVETSGDGKIVSIDESSDLNHPVGVTVLHSRVEAALDALTHGSSMPELLDSSAYNSCSAPLGRATMGSLSSSSIAARGKKGASKLLPLRFANSLPRGFENNSMGVSSETSFVLVIIFLMGENLNLVN